MSENRSCQELFPEAMEAARAAALTKMPRCYVEFHVDRQGLVHWAIKVEPTNVVFKSGVARLGIGDTLKIMGLHPSVDVTP